MPKKILTDILVKKRYKQPSKPVKQLESAEKKDRPVATNYIKSRRIRYYAIAGILIIVLFVGILNSFASVTLKIEPRQKFVNSEARFSAVNSSLRKLTFETMEITKSYQQVAKATGVQEINKKASGKIVVYNAYSSDPQKLVKKTRFQTSDGKIYRIAESITVPGAEISKGKIIPSSIEVTVYADKSGESYNIGLADFTIPGFKGSVKYEKFYARSKTNMAGGLRGEVTIISNSDLQAIENLLKEKIKSDLLAEAKSAVPSGFILYDDAIIIDFVSNDSNPKAGDETEQFTVTETGNLLAFLINKDDLSSALVQKFLDEEDAQAVNLETLLFKLETRESDNKKITFNIKDKIHFVWRIDIGALKADLIKAKKKRSKEVFSRYPNIEKAEIIFHPSWWQRIPKKPSRINYEEILKTETI